MTREEAINYFKRHINLYCVTGICREAEKMAIKALEQEPKRGRWIDRHCSECDCDEPAFIVEMFGWKWIKDMNAKYCPNCGARMADKENKG